MENYTVVFKGDLLVFLYSIIIFDNSLSRLED